MRTNYRKTSISNIKKQEAGLASSSLQIQENNTATSLITIPPLIVKGNGGNGSGGNHPHSSGVHEVNVVYIPGIVLSPSHIVIEEVYDPESEEASFVVSQPGCDIQVLPEYQHNKTLYRPVIEDAIKKYRVILPTRWEGVEEDSATLLEDVKNFIYTYSDLDPNFLEIAARYALLTSVYDCFQKLPYIRLLGTWGSGKSRFVDVLAAICYHSTNLGTAVKPANIYRNLELYPGTQFFDEADYNNSPNNSLIQQILIGGNAKSGCVYRSEYTGTSCRPTSFSTFGPKILASHTNFMDDTLESRILTSISYPTKRSDIPIDLPDYVEWQDAHALRNRLLCFRMNNRWKIKSSLPCEDLRKYDPRTIEIVNPLLQVTQETRLPESIKYFLDEREVEQQAHLETGNDGYVTKAVIHWYTNGNKQPMVGEIRERVNQLRSQGQYPLSDRAVGGIIKGLGLSKRRNNKGFYVECQEDYLKLLAKRYGITWPDL